MAPTLDVRVLLLTSDGTQDEGGDLEGGTGPAAAETHGEEDDGCHGQEQGRDVRCRRHLVSHQLLFCKRGKRGLVNQ